MNENVTHSLQSVTLTDIKDPSYKARAEELRNSYLVNLRDVHQQAEKIEAQNKVRVYMYVSEAGRQSVSLCLERQH